LKEKKMNPIYRIVIILITLASSVLGFTGCATGPDVRAEYDHSVDFSRYHTFAFFEPLGTDRSGYESIVSQYLKAATRQELEARGLRYDETAPQLRVNFNAKLSEKLRTYQSGSSLGVGYYGYRGGYYSPWAAYPNQESVSPYTEGTLNIDLVDASRKKMVWEGVAVGTVTQNNLQNLQPTINTAVRAAFTKFPVSIAPTVLK
jgi:hypothetical protein